MRTYTHRKPHSFKKVRQNLLPSNTINTVVFGNRRGWEGLKSLFLVNECQFDISTGFWYTVIVKARFARAYFFERRPSGFFPPPFPISLKLLVSRLFQSNHKTMKIFRYIGSAVWICCLVSCHFLLPCFCVWVEKKRASHGWVTQTPTTILLRFPKTGTPPKMGRTISCVCLFAWFPDRCDVWSILFETRIRADLTIQTDRPVNFIHRDYDL